MGKKGPHHDQLTAFQSRELLHVVPNNTKLTSLEIETRRIFVSLISYNFRADCVLVQCVLRVREIRTNFDTA